MKIEGVVERCAPAYSANNMLGMYFLLLGSPVVYTAQESVACMGTYTIGRSCGTEPQSI